MLVNGKEMNSFKEPQGHLRDIFSPPYMGVEGVSINLVDRNPLLMYVQYAEAKLTGLSKTEPVNFAFPYSSM